MPTRLTSGNNVINYEYDHKRRKTAVILNGVTHATYTYSEGASEDTVTTVTANEDTFVKASDKNGKVLSVKYKNNVLVQNGYDAKDRLISREDKVTGKTANFTYDSNNFLTEYSCGNTTETYEYNDRGELAIKAITGEVSQAYGYFYKNNAARNLDYISFGGYKFKPLSDVNGRNTGKEIHAENGKIAGEYISYRKVGDHATNMPSAVWFGNKNEIKDSLKYTYDKCGNITEIKENGALAVRYAYDSMNRLVREDNKKFGKTYLLEYDGNGNIVSKRQTAFTLRNNVDECDFETSVYGYEGDKLISYNGELCAYNEMGSPTAYRGKTAVWKYGKLLTEFDGKTFAYDGLGRRTGKCGICFTYDRKGNLIKQTDGTNALEFVYDNGGVIGFKYDKQYFYRKDVQGNIIAILDNEGTVVVEYNYDAWGNCDFSGDESLAELNPFRYRCYYFDTETGLYYLQTRYYDPEIGRFISQDNVKYLNTGYINGLNLYAYCKNNPVMYTDPNGNDAIYMVDYGLKFVGHAVVFVQDEAGNWYQTEYHGNGTVESHLLNKKDAFGKVVFGIKDEEYGTLEEYIGNHFSDRETLITYIKGDFSASVEKLKYYSENGYGNYCVLFHNCQHYAWEILREGDAGFIVNGYIHSVRAFINAIPDSFGKNLSLVTDISNGKVTAATVLAIISDFFLNFSCFKFGRTLTFNY